MPRPCLRLAVFVVLLVTVVTPFALDDEGMLRIPDKPGLGIEINPDAVGRFSG